MDINGIPLLNVPETNDKSCEILLIQCSETLLGEKDRKGPDVWLIRSMSYFQCFLSPFKA